MYPKMDRTRSGPLSFFFNETATTEIYTLSLHDALPISRALGRRCQGDGHRSAHPGAEGTRRSEEHTSELQSHVNLVCRLRLEKKNEIQRRIRRPTEGRSQRAYQRRRANHPVHRRTAYLGVRRRRGRHYGLFFFAMARPPPGPTLFPYTTLFR